MANDAVTPPVVGVGQHGDIQQSGVRVTARRRGHLCHLQERKHALLHARTAGAGEQHDRQTLFGRVLEQAGQLFTDDRNLWTPS